MDLRDSHSPDKASLEGPTSKGHWSEGRDSELQSLVAAFSACRSEHVGRAVVIHGAPGCGSSHIARRLRDELRRRGLVHQWWAGRCTRTAPLPYEPMAGLLRAVPGDAAGWLAEAAAAGGGEAAGVALLAGLARRIRVAAEHEPLVVFIDDVDGADASTARLLLGIVALLDDVRVLVVLAGRSSDDGLAPLDLGPVCSTEIVVRPLDGDETARLVTGAAPELDATAVTAIVQSAGGRPAVALALALAGDNERTLTALLAAIGPTAAVATLACGFADGWITTEELTTTLGLHTMIWNELERRHIVVASDRPSNAPIPASDLWFAAARRAVGPGVRPLAAAIAGLLTHHGPPATTASAWEVAGRRDQASRAWERAAVIAEADLATQTAAAAIRRAIELGNDLTLSRLGRRACELSLAAGDRIEANQLAERILPRLTRNDSVTTIAILLVRYRACLEAGLGDSDRHLDQALEVTVGSCRERIETLVLDALRRVLDDPSAAAQQASIALAQATELGDLSAIASAAGAAGLATAIAGDVQLGLSYFASALDAAARSGDAAVEARIASNRVYVLWRAGRPCDVEQAAAAELERLHVRGLGALGDQLAVGRCSALVLLGRFTEADRAVAAARSMRMAADAAALLDLVDAELALLRGEIARATALVDRVWSSPSGRLREVAPEAWLIGSWLDLARGDQQGAAVKALAGLSECGEADVAMFRLSLAWWRSGGSRGDPVPANLRLPDPVGAESRALEKQIAAHREHTAAAWSAAIAAWEEVPAPAEVLRCRLGAALDTRDLPELDRIAEAATMLGAHGISIEANSAWRASGGRHPPKRSEALLTQREIDVLACVAEGLTSKEISDRLYIGVRTVGSHLERCMGKLAVGTRGAAVHEARRRGFLSA